MEYQPGQHIGDYEILQTLGAGGMGRVYKVRNAISQRVEAMKVLLDTLTGDAELYDRFLREIRVLATLQHPNIARLNTAQRLDGQILMLMEFVEGSSLEKLMRQRRLYIPEIVRIGTQVLSALSYAHQNGVVHRDVKPANILIDEKGDAHLTDFGIALAQRDAKLTQTGRTMGSLYYMSPEQINGDPTLDQRTDLYSFGIMLYEMSTGQRPYNADSEFQIMAAHLQQTPRPPVELDPNIPPPLANIILMAIQKAAGSRFQSAEAMRRALEQVAPSVAAPAVPVDTSSSTAMPPAMPHFPQPAAPPPPSVPQSAAPPQYQPAFQPPPQQPQQNQPQQKQQYAPPPPAWQPPPAPSNGQPVRSHRALYILAGSLATVAVLVLGAIQLPRFWKTRAQQEPVTSSAQTSDRGATPGLYGNTVVSATGGGTAPAIRPDLSSTAQTAAALQQPRPSVPNAASVPPSHSQIPAGPPAVVAGQVANTPPSQGGPDAQQRPPFSQPPPGNTTASSPPASTPAASTQTPPAVDTAKLAAVGKARERMMNMAGRVGAVRTSLEGLKRSQAAMGLSVRTDFTAAEQRVVYMMDQAEAAIRVGDSETANQHLNSAELSLGFLESRLGK